MKYFLLIPLYLLLSCVREKNAGEAAEIDSKPAKEIEKIAEVSGLTDKTVKFLCRENQYDDEAKDTVNVIVINEDYCKTLTDPERAALGFVATFVGSDCWWDGEMNDDMGNLKCKVLTMLNLGYQCSDRHLGFLRKWFKNDKKALAELENCPTIPYTATSQETFDEINITVSRNKISVYFAVSGINMREGESWHYNETYHFLYEENTLRLVKKDESEVEREHFNYEDY